MLAGLLGGGKEEEKYWMCYVSRKGKMR